MNWKRLIPVIVVVAAVLGCPPATRAQGGCIGNDGFSNGPCCAPAAPNLPSFPTQTSTGLGACLRDCALESQFNVVTTLAPSQVLCDIWLVNVQITGPGFTVSGFLIAKYARTWLEFPVAGAAPMQVWRFLVNGDLNYTFAATTSIGCPIPLSAAPPFNLPVHFIGSIDWAINCATGIWSGASNLTHLCPTESHAFFSQRPIPAAAGWAKRTYHFVTPAGFTFGICPPPSGQVIGESHRKSHGLDATTFGILPYTCLNELQAHGAVTTISQNCACFDPPALPLPRYTNQLLDVRAFCNGTTSTAVSLAFPPFLPNGLRALSIGNYTVATVYPGVECVSMYIGVVQFAEMCPTPIAPPAPIHAVAGVGTVGGYPATLFDLPAVGNITKFLELEDMEPISAGMNPGIGSLFVSHLIWNLNMP